ncbi:hypothetical protein GCM10027403_14920 [Arthrobacter tecti]
MPALDNRDAPVTLITSSKATEAQNAYEQAVAALTKAENMLASILRSNSSFSDRVIRGDEAVTPEVIASGRELAHAAERSVTGHRARLRQAATKLQQAKAAEPQVRTTDKGSGRTPFPPIEGKPAFKPDEVQPPHCAERRWRGQVPPRRVEQPYGW